MKDENLYFGELWHFTDSKNIISTENFKTKDQCQISNYGIIKHIDLGACDTPGDLESNDWNVDSIALLQHKSVW